MVKYLFYILIVALTAVLIAVLPKNWKKKKWQRIVLAVYCFCSIFSFFAMISITAFTENLAARAFFNNSTLVFFGLTVSTIMTYFLRYLFTYLAIRLKAWATVKLLLNDRAFVCGVAFVFAFLMLFGNSRFNSCQIASYDVNLTDGEIPDPHQCRICLVSDLHLGAGADRAMVDRMCERLSEEHPSLICIAGDVIDMTSFEDDLRYFAEKISALKPKYGLIYCEGNHEADSDIDCQAILEEYGITCLYDEALILDNALAVAGRRCGSEIPISQLLREAAIDESTPTVVLSHVARGYESIGEGNYLVLSGDTHGYQVPFHGLIKSFACDLPYGYRDFGNMKAITTSGVSAWGFRLKWPSSNEICSITLIY